MTAVSPEVRRRSWLHPSVVSGDAGAQGRGLFTIGAIDAGTVVVVIGGQVMTEHEFRRYMTNVRPFYALAIAEEQHLVLDADDPARLGNHSCDPTMWHADAVTLVARRDLLPGDELTPDYALHTVDPAFRMACSCGSAQCRQVVAGTDWLLPELQARYAGRFSPFINARIAAR